MPASRNVLEALARLGYAARGLVYLIIGGFAVTAAIGSGGGTTGAKGALQSLVGEPFGQALLAILALGLLGYALWRFAQAIADADHHGADAKGLAIRAGELVSGIIYLGLMISALSLIFGWGTGGGDEQGTKDWTAWLLGKPFGRWLAGGIGVAVVIAGAAIVVKGWQARFIRRLAVDAGQRRWVEPVGRFGLVAHGVVLAIIGAFLIIAAAQADASEARGLSGALRALQEQPYGWILFAIVAFGLVAFGIFCFVEAAYRRVTPPSTEDMLRRSRAALSR